MIEHAMFDLQATIHVKRSPQFTMYIHIPSIQITLCKAQPRSIPDNTCSYLFCAKQHYLDFELVAKGPKNQDLDVELVHDLLEFNKTQENMTQSVVDMYMTGTKQVHLDCCSVLSGFVFDACVCGVPSDMFSMSLSYCCWMSLTSDVGSKPSMATLCTTPR